MVIMTPTAQRLKYAGFQRAPTLTTNHHTADFHHTQVFTLCTFNYTAGLHLHMCRHLTATLATSQQPFLRRSRQDSVHLQWQPSQ